MRRIAALLLLALASFAQAQEKPAWKPLFDGKTLEGWKAADLFKPGETTVANGAIRLSQGKRGTNGAMTGVVSTRKDLPTKDYEFKYQARRVEGEDFFATVTFPVKDSHCSFVTGGWGGQTIGLSSLDGMDASENDTNGSFPFESSKWYAFRVRVTAGRIQSWIDDKQVVNLDIHDRKVGIRLECFACRPLGLATYRTTGEVRDLAIRTLTPAEITESNKRTEEK